MLNVMIVDDCETTRDYFKKLLNRLDINRISEACDGLEAVALYEKHKPDIVFMDIAMPKLNGIEAMKVINERNQHTNIIMITSFDDQNVIYEALSSGAKGFVVKPLNLEKLKKEINKIVSFLEHA